MRALGAAFSNRCRRGWLCVGRRDDRRHRSHHRRADRDADGRPERAAVRGGAADHRAARCRSRERAERPRGADPPRRSRREVDRRVHRRAVQRRLGLDPRRRRGDREGDRLAVHADLRRPAVGEHLRRARPVVLARPRRWDRRGEPHEGLRLGAAPRHPGRARRRGRRVLQQPRGGDALRARLGQRGPRARATAPTSTAARTR